MTRQTKEKAFEDAIIDSLIINYPMAIYPNLSTRIMAKTSRNSWQYSRAEIWRSPLPRT
jgi:hypothetical protein